jgi:hypothetical protein
MSKVASRGCQIVRSVTLTPTTFIKKNAIGVGGDQQTKKVIHASAQAITIFRRYPDVGVCTILIGHKNRALPLAGSARDELNQNAS